MRVLYHTLLSPAARKVRVVLREKNLDFTLKAEKIWERRPEFLALNPGRRGAGADRARRHRARGASRNHRISRRGLSREDADRHQPGRPRRSAAADRMVRHQDEPRSHREPARREDDEAVSRRGAAELAGDSRRSCQSATSSRLYRLSRRASALARRRPFLDRRHHRGGAAVEPRLSGRRARGTPTSRPRNGTRGSSRGRAFVRSSPTICREPRRRRTMQISISDIRAKGYGVLPRPKQGSAVGAKGPRGLRCQATTRALARPRKPSASSVAAKPSGRAVRARNPSPSAA